VNGDPIGSEAPRGKSCEKRMGRYDGGFTPSEQRLKNQLMKQFMKHGGEGPGGNSAAYQEGWERTFGKKSAPDVGTLASFNELAKEMTNDWLQRINTPDVEWMSGDELFRSLNRDPYRANYDLIDWSK